MELRDNSGTFSIAAASGSNEANNDDDDDGIMIVFTHNPFNYFLVDRTNGRAYATVLRLSVCLSVVVVVVCRL